MGQIEVVSPSGEIITVSSNNHNAEGVANIVINRQKVVAQYCQKKGWSTDTTELSFDQILEIRKTKEWIDAGK